MPKPKIVLTAGVAVLLAAIAASAQLFARAPGARGGPAGVGGMLRNLTASQQSFFRAGATAFEQLEAPSSEANGVIARFNQLTEPQTQDVLNFLRSL